MFLQSVWKAANQFNENLNEIDKIAKLTTTTTTTMSRNRTCRACQNKIQGVKTRVAVTHTCGMNEQQVNNAHELANKWITELLDAGYSYDDMGAIFNNARLQYDNYKQRKERKVKSSL